MNQKFNLIRQILTAFILVALFTGISSCEKYSYPLPSVSLVDTLHFSTDIQPIFTANCITCHGAAKAPDLRPDKSYLALTNGGYVNVPAEAETSLLYTIIISAGHESRSSSADKQKVLIWIKQGSLNN